MDKALLDYEVSIDANCQLATVGKPFAIEGETPSLEQSDSRDLPLLLTPMLTPVAQVTGSGCPRTPL